MMMELNLSPMLILRLFWRGLLVEVLLGVWKDGSMGQILDNQTVYSNLSCYQCMESFHKKVWYPYTDCQRNPSKLHLRRCGFSDNYCKVERVEWNGFVVTMERGCTDVCYWGCRYEGFGITRLRCTSCCNKFSGCNTDNGVMSTCPRRGLWITLATGAMLGTLLYI